MEEGMYANKKKFITKKTWTNKMRAEKEEQEEIAVEALHRGTKFSRITPMRIKFSPQEVTEPDYDEDSVILSWYDSDLNLIIDEKNFTAASPLHERGFCYLQAGARATYGFFSGKVCFEVKLLNCCKLLYKEGHLNTHLLRVGWSPRKATLALGSDHKSYGYDSTGRASTVGEIMDYGKKFSTGDVVGAYLDLSDDTVSISFTLNGVDQGIAYEIPQLEIQKEPLFPHVLTKNISYECHFGGEEPWFPLKEGYSFVGDVPMGERIAGPKRPKSKSDCEVIMMCGLPKSGKTSWVNDLREKNPGMFYVIDTAALVDRMEGKDPDRKVVLIRKTRVMGKLLAIAMDRRRNYVLDQVNVVRSEQLWKLGLFKYFMRRIVVVVIPDAELQRRIENANDRPPGDLSWLLQLKAKFVLPTHSCPHIATVADTVEFVDLPEDEALQLVKQYNHEAWRLGYKPHKNFVIPGYVFKEKQKKVPGSWKERITGTAFRNADSSGSGWISPPRTTNDGDWQSPTRNRNNEEWLAPRRRVSGDRQSPPRKRGNEEWQSPRNRGGSGARSPFRIRDENEWHQKAARSGDDWESPSRNRPNDRWEPQQDRFVRDTRSPPRSRIEDWQSQGARPLDRRISPPRRSPDGDQRYGGRHSPVRNMIGDGRALPDTVRSDFHFQEDRSHSRVHEDRFVSNQLHQEDRIDDSWSSREGIIGSAFPSHEKNMRSVHPHDDNIRGNIPLQEDRASGHFPAQDRINEGFPPHERMSTGNFHSREGRRSGDFPPGGGRLGSRFSGPQDRMERNMQEDRLSGDMLIREERMGVISHPRDGNMSADFAPRDNRGFPHQESRVRSDFHYQEDRVDIDFLPVDKRMGVGFPAMGSKMVGGLPPRIERMSGDLPPQEARIGNFPLREGRHAGEFLSHEARTEDDMAPHRGRISGDFSPHRGNISGNLPPHGGRMGSDFPPLEGRIGSSLPHHQDRLNERPPHSGRMVRDLSPRDHMMGGDIPPHEGRTSSNFPLHEGRQGNDFPVRDSRMSGDLPTHLGRSSDVQPLEGRMSGGNLPLRMDDLPPRGGRTGGDLPHRGGRGHADLAPRGGRIEADLIPHEIRIGGDSQPHDERARSGDQWNRLAPKSDHSANFGPLSKQDWPDEREMRNKEDRFDSARGSGIYHPDPSWPKDRRIIQQSRWDSPQSDTQHHLFKADQLDSQEHGRGPSFHFREDSASMNSHSGSAGRMSLEARTKGGWEPEVGRPGGSWQLQDDVRSRGHQPDRMLPPGNIPENRGQQFTQQRGDSREHDRSSTRFQDNRDGSPNRTGMGHWQSPSGRPRQSEASPEGRPRHNSRSPVGRNKLDQRSPVGARLDHRSPVSRPGARSPPVRPVGRRQSPMDRSRGDRRSPPSGRLKDDRRSPPGRSTEGHRSPVGRPESRGRSPVAGRSGSWQNPGGGRSVEWQSHEERNRGSQRSPERRGPGDRLLPNLGRGDPHSPPRKNPRLEPRKLIGPNVLFPDGEEERNEHNMTGWKSPERGHRSRKPSEGNRDGNRGRALPGNESHVGPDVHDTAFGAHRTDAEGSANQSAVFPSVGDDIINEPGAGTWQPSGGRGREAWQSPTRSGSSRGSRWERVPQDLEGLNTENEELAPYEQPFNQAVWDSNEPDAGVSRDDNHSRSGNLHRMEDRNRESSRGSRHETGPHSVSRPRGSVWQRVGGYVDDDDKERSVRTRPSRFSNRSPSDSRGERESRNIGDVKERERNFDETRNRRGHATSSDKPEGMGRKRVSPFRDERGFLKESQRDHWKSPAKRRGGRW